MKEAPKVEKMIVVAPQQVKISDLNAVGDENPFSSIADE